MKKSIVILSSITFIVAIIAVLSLFKLDLSGTPVNKIAEDEFENSTIPVIIQNIDKDDNTKYLSGGQVSVVNRDTEKALSYVFDEDGMIKLELEEGNYIVKEMIPSADYYENNIFSQINVTKQGVEANETQTIILENTSMIGNSYAENISAYADENPNYEIVENVIQQEPEAVVSAPVSPGPNNLAKDNKIIEHQNNNALISDVVRENPQTSDGLFVKEIMLVISATICLGLFIAYSYFSKINA